MAIPTPIRVAIAAVALTTLSFAAGVAGDLTMIDPPRSGVSVVLRIPPELPADTPRAAPLPPLTDASAAQTPRSPRAEEVAVAVATPQLSIDTFVAMEAVHIAQPVVLTQISAPGAKPGQPMPWQTKPGSAPAPEGKFV